MENINSNSSALESLKQMTTVVADTGDFECKFSLQMLSIYLHNFKP